MAVPHHRCAAAYLFRAEGFAVGDATNVMVGHYLSRMSDAVRFDDQSATLALLGDPATHGGCPVRRIDTHGAVVFLAGDRAYKVKRAVRLPFLDYSTLDRRRRACVDELRLNRRTAPDLYLGLAAIVAAPDGRLALVRDPAAMAEGVPAGGDPVGGVTIDWAVVMARFPDEALLDSLAARNALTPGIMVDLAEAIATFHEEAEPRPELGGAADMRDIAAGIVARLRAFPSVFPADGVARLDRAMQGSFDRFAALMDRRRDAGYVRHCHGDLHLRNIVLLDGRPVPFDCIEFDERYAVTDVLYDLAFLLMDMEHRRLRGLANVLFNRYLELTGDLAGLALLPLFLAMRAGIRAHVGATAAEGRPPEVAAAMRAESVGYLNLALACIRPPPACLVAVGGLSGTGKTTLARNLAPGIGPVPGAVILRSDVLRKRLLGVDETVRLGSDGYGEAVTARVYAEMQGRAGLALESRHAVICDAVYARPEQRRSIEAIARAAQLPFAGLWLVADQETQLARVGGRTGDASDATADVVRRQGCFDLGEMTWDIVPAHGGPGDVLGIARRLVHGATAG